MNARASQLIELLRMVPHPEGGHYCEIYRSVSRVRPVDERPERSAVTTIYFLLTEGETSRWHRVKSDEVWHFYEGDVLELSTADAHAHPSQPFKSPQRHRLGPVGENIRPAVVVPAGVWQSARTTGAYTLVGCTVAPGFDFADFQILDEPRTRNPEP
jgi:predicted cupin superfamily sugar epimerase